MGQQRACREEYDSAGTSSASKTEDASGDSKSFVRKSQTKTMFCSRVRTSSLSSCPWNRFIPARVRKIWLYAGMMVHASCSISSRIRAYWTSGDKNGYSFSFRS